MLRMLTKMKQENKTYKRLIVKYLTEGLDGEEKKGFQKWLDTKKNRRKFKEYLLINYHIDRYQSPFDKDKAFSVFLKHKKKKIVLRRILIIVLVIMLIFITFYMLLTINNN